MSGLFGTGKATMPDPKPVRMPTEETADEIAKRKMRRRAMSSGGRRSTILSDLSARVGNNNLGAGG